MILALSWKKEYYNMIIKKELSISPTFPMELYAPNEKVLFFDIETTGFSALHTVLYLIGCCYFDHGWKSIQWFNESGTKQGEQLLLSQFFSFVNGYELLIHFNGSGFDIPYLKKKIAAYHLDYSFASLTQLDLYKMLRPYQSLLSLSSLKQKAIENYLDLNREDKYNGGELIKFYQEYLTTKHDATLNLLLTHNQEDIEGLMLISNTLGLATLYQGNFQITKVEKTEKECVFSGTLLYPVLKRITIGKQNIFLMVNDNKLTLRITLIQEELKYFYHNYKDYYYLPVEDTAIHKSVAFYVDKEFRTQAKATTCYTRKSGEFLPQFDILISPCFHRNLKEKMSFFEPNDTFIDNKEQVQKYVLHILLHLL